MFVFPRRTAVSCVESAADLYATPCCMAHQRARDSSKALVRRRKPGPHSCSRGVRDSLCRAGPSLLRGGCGSQRVWGTACATCWIATHPHRSTRKIQHGLSSDDRALALGAFRDESGIWAIGRLDFSCGRLPKSVLGPRCDRHMSAPDILYATGL